MTIKPYPDIDAAAWTVLLRAPSGQRVTAEIAAEIVGPDLAADALHQLDAKHLILEDGISPLGEAFRRWHRRKGDA